MTEQQTTVRRQVQGTRGRVMIVAGLLVLSTFSFGGAATCVGALSYTIDGVWDVTGNYGTELPDLGFLGVTASDVDFSLSMDAKGKITGGGSFSLCIDDVGCCGTVFNLKGTIKTKGPITVVKIVIKIKARCDIPGERVKYSITETLNLEIDETSSARLCGTVKIGGSVCAAGYGCIGLKALAKYLQKDLGVEFPLVYDVCMDLNDDGQAPLDLTVTAVTDKKRGGTATLDLFGATPYRFTIKGVYKERTGVEKLVLKGDRATAKGAKLILTMDCATPADAMIKGKVAGQKIYIP